MIRKVLTVTFLTTCLMLAESASALAADPRPPHAALVGVVRSSGGTPLAGICVNATSVANAQAPRTVVTDSRGRYRLDADVRRLGGGSQQMGYAIAFTPCRTKANVAPEWFSHVNTYDSEWKIVSLRAGKTATLNLALRAGATIAGTVRASPSLPIAGACVHTRNFNNVEMTTKTDAAGNYRFTQLVPAVHEVWVNVGCVTEISGVQSSNGAGSTTLLIQTAMVGLHEGETATGVDFSATV